MAYEDNQFIVQGSNWTTNSIMYVSNTSGRFPVNMSSYANGAGQLKKTLTSNAAANISVSIYSSNANGICVLTMNNQVTGALTHGRYLYDVKVIKPTGEVDQVVRGMITIHPQITRGDW